MIAKLNNWRGSSRKFVNHLRAVQRKNAILAAEALRFNISPYAAVLRKLIMSAVANASNDPKVNVNNLFIHEASAGRGTFLKRACFRGRGRVGRVTKPHCNVYVVLKELDNGK